MAAGAPPGLILVGRFGAPHGVRGEIRLQSFTQDPKAIGSYGPLASADGRRFVLASLRPVKDAMLVVRIDGIADRSAAEALTHTDLFVARDALPAPDEDEFYIADLIGCEAMDVDGKLIGTIVDVPNYGGGDLVEIRHVAGGETLLFAFMRETVPTVDLVARRVTIVPPDEVEDSPAEPPA